MSAARSLRRRIAAGLVGVAALAAVAAPGSTVGPAGAQDDPGPMRPPVVDTLARCVQDQASGGSPRVLVQVLMDESRSLGGSDPDQHRVDGIQAVLGGLQELSQSSLGVDDVTIDVQLAAFAGKYRDVSDWLTLDDSTADDLNAVAERLRTEKLRPNTDYVNALAGARSSLAKRAADVVGQGGAPPCKVLVWFTDGSYDVSDASNAYVDEYAPDVEVGSNKWPARVRSQGIARLCGATSLADEVRNDDILMFTLALTASKSWEPQAGEFLDRLTTGQGGGKTCGTLGSEDLGLYQGVGDSQRLAHLFGNLFDPTEIVVCDVTPIDEPCGDVDLVPGLSRFSVQGVLLDPAVQLVLTPPEGDPVVVERDGPRTQEVSGATLTARWLPTPTVTVVGDLGDDPAWVGTWRVGFTSEEPVDEQTRPSYAVQRYADVQAVLAAKPSLPAGERTPLDIRLQRLDGTPLSVGPLVADTEVRASITDPTTSTTEELEVEPLGAGRFRVVAAPPLETETSSISLRLEARFRPGTVPVIPTVRFTDLDVDAPPEYPTIEPDELSIPLIQGTEASAGTVTVVSSKIADGCVWIDATALTASSDAGDVLVAAEPDATTSGSCLEVPKGSEPQEIEISVRTEHPADGSINGEVRFRLQSDANPALRTQRVPVTAVQETVVPVSTRLLVTVVLLLGALLPLLGLHLLNRFSARFEPLAQLRYLSTPVQVHPRGAIELLDGTPFAPDPREYELMRISGGAERERSFDFSPFTFRACASGSFRDGSLRLGSIFAGPFGTVRGPEPSPGEGPRTLVVGSGVQALRSWRDGSVHEVPLSLRGTWLFLTDPVTTDDQLAALSAEEALRSDLSEEALAGPPVRGTLLLIAADNRGIAQFSQLRDQVRIDLPAVVASLDLDGAATPPGVASRPSPLASLRGRLRRPPRAARSAPPTSDDDVPFDEDALRRALEEEP